MKAKFSQIVFILALYWTYSRLLWMLSLIYGWDVTMEALIVSTKHLHLDYNERKSSIIQDQSRALFLAGFVFLALELASIYTTFNFIQTRLQPISPGNARFNYYNGTSQSIVYYNTTGQPDVYVVPPEVCLPSSPDRIKDNFRGNLAFMALFFWVAFIVVLSVEIYGSFRLGNEGIDKYLDGNGKSKSHVKLASPFLVQLGYLTSGKGWLSEHEQEMMEHVDFIAKAATGYCGYAQLFVLAVFTLMCSSNSSFQDIISLSSYVVSALSTMTKFKKIVYVISKISVGMCFCCPAGRACDAIVGTIIGFTIIILPIISYITYVPF